MKKIKEYEIPMYTSEASARSLGAKVNEIIRAVNQLQESVIKPILVIKLPSNTIWQSIETTNRHLREHPLSKDYHFIVAIGLKEVAEFELLSLKEVTESKRKEIEEAIKKLVEKEK